MKLKAKCKQSGFSMMELMVAMLVLSAGILGGMSMVVIGMSRNSSNRVDTTGTNVAQTVLEEIAAVPSDIDTTFNITDCINTTQSNSPLVVGTAVGGANQLSNGDIDFSQDPTTIAANYHISYTVCSPGQPATVFDVRWHVTAVGNGGACPSTGCTSKLITVSARQPVIVTRTGISWLPPVTLRTVVGM